MADNGKGIPGWVWALVIIVGLWFLVKQIGLQAQKTISTVGQTKANTAQGYANAATSFVGGLGTALGSFFGPGSVNGGSSTAFAPDKPANDSASLATWNATSTSTFDDLAAADASAGVEGPF